MQLKSISKIASKGSAALLALGVALASSNVPFPRVYDPRVLEGIPN